MHKITLTYRDYRFLKDGTAQIYMQLFIQKRKLEIPLGIYLKPEQWNKAKREIKGSDTSSDDKRMIIGNALAAANNIFVRYRLQNKTITPDLFREEFKNPSINIDFYLFMHSEIMSRQKMVAQDTIDHHLVVLRKLKKFKPELAFSELNQEFFEKFQKYLITHYKNGINTVTKNFKAIKYYINRAIQKEKLEKSPLQYMKFKTTRSNPVFLTEEELIRVINYYKICENNNHKIVLQYFLFSCFTSLRISDIKQLSYRMIINNTIYIRPQKTRHVKNESISIPLSIPARKILKEQGPNKIQGFVFNVFPDQTTNRFLKEIAIPCKIKKRLTTHVARHTFATLFLKKTNDLATLSQLMGHSSVSQTMIYVHICDDDKEKGIATFNGFQF